MQYIDQHHDVKAPIRMGHSHPIEPPYGDVCVGANQDVDPFDCKLRPARVEPRRQESIPASHVQDTAWSLGDHRRQVMNELRDSSAVDETFVDAIDVLHSVISPVEESYGRAPLVTFNPSTLR